MQRASDKLPHPGPRSAGHLLKGLDMGGSSRRCGRTHTLKSVVAVAGRRLLRHPLLSAACAVLFLLVVVQPPPLTRVITGWPPPGWRFAICDVGQGDATVLAVGDGSAVVVDAGPDPVLVDRCLSRLGVTRIRW